MPASFDPNHVTKLQELYSFLTGVWGKCKNLFATKTELQDAIASIPDPLPESTPDDEGKVLTVDSLGAPSWAIVPSQATGLFEALYGTTTYADIRQAIADKKIVYCRISAYNSSSRMAFLAYIGLGTPRHIEFQYYRSNSDLTASDSVFVYDVDVKNNWTTTERPVGIKAQVNSDWNASSGAAQILNKPSIPSATSDLTNNSGFITASDVPAAQDQADWTESDSSDPAYIKNKPNLATVATSGDYDDLTNKPSIPAAQVNSDWNASSGVAQILNKPTLATVATSGSYNDLTDKPTIPTVPVQGVEVDGVSVVNASGIAEIDLTGKVDKVSGKDLSSNDFTDADVAKLNGIEAGAQVNVQADWTETNSSSDAYIQNKPANLVQDANYVHTDNNYTTADKDKLAGIEAGAEVNVQADWSQTSSSADSYIKNKPANLVQDASYVHTDNNFTTTLKNKLDGIASGAEVNVQANWTEADSSSDAYIRNKPSLATVATSGSYNDLSNIPANLVQDANYVHTDENFTSAEKTKLAGIEAGAEVNVQADWDQTSSSADDFIKNKPATKTLLVGTGVSIVETANDITISATGGSGTQVQADWTESDTTDPSYIQNKPDEYSLVAGSNVTIVKDDNDKEITVSASFTQAQSDWSQSDSSAADYIKNKPSLATVATSGSYNDLSNTPSLATVATSGDYDDLTNKPTIPAAQVNSDWNASSGVAQILNKPTLATVATTGSYNDLSNTPTIPEGVPSYTTSEDGKVLGVVDNSGTAALQWVTQSGGGSSSVLMMDYTDEVVGHESDSWTAYMNAYNAGKICMIILYGRILRLVYILDSGSYIDGRMIFFEVGSEPLSGWNYGFYKVTFRKDYSTSAVTTTYEAGTGHGFNVVPNHTTNEVGKVLTVKESSGYSYYTWDNPPSPLPTVTSSDDGKVLTASYSGGAGSYSWQPASGGGTVDQTYNASSTNAQSGTAVAGAITTVRQVPASVVADSGKVLTVNSSGNPEWEALATTAQIQAIVV